MPKISPLSSYEKVKEACKEPSVVAALTQLGLRAAGGNYKSFYAACEKFGLTPPSYDRRISTGIARRTMSVPDSLVFCVDSTYANRTQIKKRLQRLGIAQECSECGLGPEWNKKPLTLTLEHINGIFNDNRLENLTLLCPNCHSQTSTFAGRSKGKTALDLSTVAC